MLYGAPRTRGLLIKSDDDGDDDGDGDDSDAGGDDGDGDDRDAGGDGGQWALFTSLTGLIGSRAIWCTLGTLQNLFCFRYCRSAKFISVSGCKTCLVLD